jgi:hypothetical protein
MSNVQQIWPNSRLLIETGRAHGTDLLEWL